MTEEWKDIYYTDSITGELIDFRGYYQVSNTKKVRNKRTGRILKPNTNNGYAQYILYKNGKIKVLKRCRIVAHMFIPNPDNLPFVNHMDEERTNDIISNLEWCTGEYNSNYGTLKKRASKRMKGNKNYIPKPVLQYTLDGIFLNDYPSIQIAAEENKTNASSICACCMHKRKTAGLYRWEYL